jgi:ADP-heptose:LPS heptosyltransferase
VERGLSLAAAAGFPAPAGDDRRLAVRLPAGVRPPRVPRPFVAVHPGASVPARAPEAAFAAELVEALRAAGRTVVVTGGPGETALTGRVAGPPRHGVIDLGGRTSFAELAGLLAGADALVVGNTGPAHLAAAVGTPVVSLYAPTVPAVRWRPWGVPHAVLGVPVPCAGGRARACPVPGHPCLGELPVEAALEALERLAPAPSAVAREVA